MSKKPRQVFKPKEAPKLGGKALDLSKDYIVHEVHHPTSYILFSKEYPGIKVEKKRLEPKKEQSFSRDVWCPFGILRISIDKLLNNKIACKYINSMTNHQHVKSVNIGNDLRDILFYICKHGTPAPKNMLMKLRDEPKDLEKYQNLIVHSRIFSNVDDGLYEDSKQQRHDALELSIGEIQCGNTNKKLKFDTLKLLDHIYDLGELTKAKYDKYAKIIKNSQ